MAQRQRGKLFRAGHEEDVATITSAPTRCCIESREGACRCRVRCSHSGRGVPARACARGLQTLDSDFGDLGLVGFTRAATVVAVAPLVQQFQPFRPNHRTLKEVDTGDVAARAVRLATRPSSPDRRRSRRRSESSRSPPLLRLQQACRQRGDHRHLTANQIGRQAPAVDHIDPPPSGIRSPHSGLRHSRFRSGPAESAAIRRAALSGDALLRNPITGIAGCCARAASGHAAAAPPSSVMNSRRSHSITSSARASSVGGTVEAERLGGLEIDHQFVLGRRLHRQVGGLLALEDAVDVAGRAPVLVDVIGPVGNQAAGGDEVAVADRPRAVDGEPPA